MPDYFGINTFIENARWFVSSDTVWSVEYRQRKIEDYRGFTVAMVLALGPMAGALWIWDLVVNPAQAANTLWLRVLCILIGVLAAALYGRLRNRLALRAVVFAAIIAIELIYSRIFVLLNADPHYGEASYLFFAFGVLLVTMGFPAGDAMLMAVTLGIVPHLLSLAGFMPGFDHVRYAVVVWPGIAMASAAMLANAYMYSRLYVARNELERVSAVDPLTGAANRRDFMPVLEKELGRSRRFGHPLALLMLDLDEFKRVNDERGHGTGDAVLSRFAEVCRRVIRQSDTLARLGGDEFVILLPETDMEGGLRLAEAIRAVADDEPLLGDNAEPVRCTVSLGVVVAEDGDANGESLLARADALLYEAKQAGRNCVRPALARRGFSAATDGDA